MNQKNVIIISGPTATGKTSTSIRVAKELNAEIINFDSIYFYHELNIGSAKPTLEEMNGIPHHLIGIQSINEPLNAADFIKLAIPLINTIHKNGKPVILTGGSGFYLQAILNGMYESISTSDEITHKSQQLYETRGIESFRTILKENDLKSFEQIHENDHYRTRRAVEHFWQTGNKFSDQKDKMPDLLKNSPVAQNEWNIIHCYLDIPKDEHFEIIEKRTNLMIQRGLESETSQLLNEFSKDLKPLQSIGYKEMVAFLEGEFSSLLECVERINISTRQLAKAQRTWFKKVEKVSFNPLIDQENIIPFIKSKLI